MRQITCGNTYTCRFTAEEMEMTVINWRSEIRWDMPSSKTRTAQLVTGISINAFLSLNVD